MSYRRGRSRGGSRYTPPAPVDRAWDKKKVGQVLMGLLQAAGRIPGPGADQLAAMFGGGDAQAFGDTLYVELGRDLGAMIKAAYVGKVLYTDGAPLINPQDLGPGLVGNEAGFIDNLIESGAEAVETMTGGLISTDDGGIDASMLSAVIEIAEAMGA